MGQTRTVAMIQARLGSTRFPRKVLEKVNGKTLIELVAKTAKRAKLLDDVVVIMPTGDIDLANECRNKGIHWSMGSEKDVLKRFYDTAKMAFADPIIRLTGDCPLIEPETIDALINEYRQNDVDYVTNSYNGFNDGYDVEVFGFKILQNAHENATNDYDREHVTTWIKANGRCLYTPIAGIHRGKFSIDTKEDLERIRGEILWRLIPLGMEVTGTQLRPI